MENYLGLYYVLASWPIWETIFVFYLLTQFVVDAGRELFEGFSYNISHAARYGDVGLFIIIIIGVTILQRGLVFESFIATRNFQFTCAGIGILAGIIMFLIEFYMVLHSVSRQLVDIYHNIIILPLFVYLLVSLIPVIYFHGNLTDQSVTAVCFLFWFVLVLYDIKNKRLDQRSWLKENGYSIILKK